jgi:outer membrane protein OmpA-like peptidoglycan-associated protein
MRNTTKFIALSRLTLCGFLIAGVAAWGSPRNSEQAPQSSSVQVEPMEKTPVFRVNVVSRTTQAVNYQHKGGSTKIDFRGSTLMPQASGNATVESKTGRVDIEARFHHLQPAPKFGLEYLTYVLWAITPEGRAANLGELLLDDDGNGGLHVTTELQAFGLLVTAEPYFGVTQPSDLVVAENYIRPDTLGREEQIHARFELLPRGMYASSVEPIADPIFGVDKKLPLNLLEARNAVRVARAAKADQYASASFQKAQDLLRQAEVYYRDKRGKTPIGTVARDAVQTAEDARVISLRKQQEERLEAERRAAADREASARAEADAQSARRAEAESEQARAERAKAEAERAKLDADAARAAAQEQQRSAESAAEQSRLAAEQARSAAQESERQRQKAEEDKAALRARLLQQFNAILATRDSARGLIINMSDVLFETGKYALRPAARERLAKVAGIVLAYPDLHLAAEGHTDSVGGDSYNQTLSERRAASVRDYLVQQGVPIATVTSAGFGKTQPVASNSTAEGRQLNRRVELVVSGEVIGATIGVVVPPTTNPQRQ